jgi:hypothetical protein
MFIKIWNLIRAFASCVTEAQKLRAEMHEMNQKARIGPIGS